MASLRVLALIPARGGSKRVPGKNMRQLGGKRLIEWTFDAALAAARVDRIVLSSDDPDLLAYGRAAKIEVIKRPAVLASDTASSADVALHALDTERAAGREWDALCLLQPTSPFRAPGRIDEGVSLLAGRRDIAAVVGVKEAHPHPFHCFLEAEGGVLSPAAGDAARRAVRTQDLPPAVALTGSFYVIRCDSLRRNGSFVPATTVGLLCNAPGEAIDIDTPADFAKAESFAASLGRSA